jgi:hypothetical protein
MQITFKYPSVHSSRSRAVIQGQFHCPLLMHHLLSAIRLILALPLLVAEPLFLRLLQKSLSSLLSSSNSWKTFNHLTFSQVSYVESSPLGQLICLYL